MRVPMGHGGLRQGGWCSSAAAGCRRATALVLECFKSRDDLVQAGLDAAQVLAEPELAVGAGLGDETAVGGGLPPVDLQELGVVWKSGQVRQASLN